MFSWWIPSEEKNRSFGVIMSGESLGVVIAYCVAPFLNHHFGWQSIL